MTNENILKWTKQIERLQKKIKSFQESCDHKYIQNDYGSIDDGYAGTIGYWEHFNCEKCGKFESRTKYTNA